jgi:hypothetical protein
MPAMLRNYSHHATNYHPELWRGSPGSGRYSPQASSARCRQEGIFVVSFWLCQLFLTLAALCIVCFHGLCRNISLSLK